MEDEPSGSADSKGGRVEYVSDINHNAEKTVIKLKKTSTTRSQVAACVPTVLVGINRTMQMVWIVTGTKR